MNTTAFQPSALALSIAAACATPVMAQDIDSTGVPLKIRDLASSGYKINGFDLTPLPNAQFAVTWTEGRSSADANVRERLLLQTFDRQGEKTSEALVLYETGAGKSEAFGTPVIAADKAGKLVIAWEVLQQFNQKSCVATGNIINAVGVVPPYDSLNAFNVDLPAFMGSNPCSVDVVMDNDGDFAIAWADRKPSGNFDLNIKTYQAGYIPSIGKTIAHDTKTPGVLALNDLGIFSAGWKDADFKPTGLYLDQQLAVLGDPFLFDNGLSSSIEFFGVSPDANAGFVFYWSQGRFAQLQRWQPDRSAGKTTDFGTDATGSIYSGSPSVETDSQGNLIATWNAFDNGNFHQAAVTAVDANSQPIVDTFEYDSDSEHSPNLSARVAMSDELIAVAWSATATELNAKVYAPLFQQPEPVPEPEPDTTNNPTDSSSGGSAGFLVGLLVVLLAQLRRVYRRQPSCDV